MNSNIELLFLDTLTISFIHGFYYTVYIVAICRKILVFSDNYDEKGAHITPRQFRRQLDKKTSVLAPHMETL